MKTLIGTSEEFPNPEPKEGYSIWIENGNWFTAPKVDPNKFGEHDYMTNDYLGDCECGCYMGNSSSSGPVDPFGACPKKPK